MFIVFCDELIQRVSHSLLLFVLNVDIQAMASSSEPAIASSSEPAIASSSGFDVGVMLAFRLGLLLGSQDTRDVDKIKVDIKDFFLKHGMQLCSQDPKELENIKGDIKALTIRTLIMRKQVRTLLGDDSSDADEEEKEEPPKKRKVAIADDSHPTPTVTGRSEKWDWQRCLRSWTQGGFWFCRACKGADWECMWERTNPECACGGIAEVCDCWSPQSFRCSKCDDKT